MTSEELTSLMRAVPFVPFALCRDEGDVPILDRDWIAHRPGASSAVVCTPDDSFEVVDLASAYAETLDELARQDADDIAACRDAREEFRRGEYVTLEQLKTELGL